MKTNDLMIWDLVSVPHDGKASHYGRVNAIYGNGRIDVLFQDGTSALCSSVDPIPLTPEILEKNGFERKQKTFEYFEYKEKGLDIEIEYFESCICTDIEWSVPGSCGYNRLHSITIENVHELQHALLLCGINKEIVV